MNKQTFPEIDISNFTLIPYFRITQYRMKSYSTCSVPITWRLLGKNKNDETWTEIANEKNNYALSSGNFEIFHVFKKEMFQNLKIDFNSSSNPTNPTHLGIKSFDIELFTSSTCISKHRNPFISLSFLYLIT